MINLKREKIKRIAKRISALATAVAMAATFTFPAEIGDGFFDGFGNAIVASAAEIYNGSALDISNGSIVINSDNITQGSTSYTYSDGQMIIVTGTSTTNYISVNSGKTTDITLQNASVGGSLASNVAAVSITGSSTANITLVGSNTLTGGYNAPGVFVAKDNTVSFTAASTGSLTASGNNQAPGIGASATAEGGHIIVNGGDITVKAGGYTATNALGSAFANCNKPAQSFTMTGGKVCAVPTKGFSSGFFGDNVSTTAVTVSGDIIISGGIFISQFETIQSHGTGIGGKLITTDSGNAVIWTKFGCYNGSAISDTSNKAEWHGVIIEGYTNAKVYGSNVTLPGDFTIETDVDGFDGDVVLEVPEGSTLVIPSGVKFLHLLRGQTTRTKIIYS